MSWVCLRVATRSERRVLSLLTEAGVMAYAPMETRKVEVRSRHIRRHVPRTAALIPSYVFAYLPSDVALDAARSVRLVREIMADPFGKPKAVDVAKLRGLFLADLFRCFDATWEPPKPKGYVPRFKAGARVRGISRNVEGWIGEVIGFRGHRQVEVMFERNGKTMRAFVEDANLIEEISKQKLEAA